MSLQKTFLAVIISALVIGCSDNEELVDPIESEVAIEKMDIQFQLEENPNNGKGSFFLVKPDGEVVNVGSRSIGNQRIFNLSVEKMELDGVIGVVTAHGSNIHEEGLCWGNVDNVSGVDSIRAKCSKDSVLEFLLINRALPYQSPKMSPFLGAYLEKDSKKGIEPLFNLLKIYQVELNELNKKRDYKQDVTAILSSVIDDSIALLKDGEVLSEIGVVELINKYSIYKVNAKGVREPIHPYDIKGTIIASIKNENIEGYVDIVPWLDAYEVYMDDLPAMMIKGGEFRFPDDSFYTVSAVGIVGNAETKEIKTVLEQDNENY